jgi:hypothetical protein
LFAALGLEWAGVQNLRRSVTTGQAQEWMKLLGGLSLVEGPSVLVLLMTGIYVSATTGGMGDDPGSASASWGSW